jgi:hypothetical protein
MSKFLIVLFTLTLSISIYAQSPSFGIKGGVNVASVRLQHSGNAGAKIGYHAGILSQINFAPKWAFQPELLYSRQGSRQSLSGSAYDFSFVYTNIPFLIQYMLNKGFRLEAGPQIGFLLSAKNTYNGNERDIKSNYKIVDFSFPIGVSYSWKSGLGIDARWVPGISEMQVTYGSSTNNVFQFGLFYQSNTIFHINE